MPYTITLSNGGLLTTIADDTLDNTTSLTLLGRNYIGYGSIVAENFVYMLENFANVTPPSSPLTGQIWYNTATSTLEIWNGTAWGPIAAESSGLTITDTTGSGSGLVFYDPLGPLNGKYFRLRVRDDGSYAGTFVIESLNDDLSLNTVILNTDTTGDGSILVDASVPEVASDSALPTVTTAPLSVYSVANWAANNTPSLASRDLTNDIWRLYPAANNRTAGSVTGATHTYAITDNYPLVPRSNGGAAMVDTLPGTSPAILPVGWQRTIRNVDATAMLVISSGSGANFNGSSLAKLYLGPQQSATIYSDGTQYYTLNQPNRGLLDSALNLYVSTTGNDNNHGLLSTAPFLTMLGAASVALKAFDTQTNSININVAAGAYTAGAVLPDNSSLVGGGVLHFIGNTATPSSVTVTLGAAGACFLASNCYMSVSGFTLSAPVGAAGNPGYCLGSQLAGILTYDHITFNTAQYCHTSTGEAGFLEATGPYTIAGGAQYHMIAGSGSSNNVVTGQNVSLTGTPAFSAAFAYADSSALVYIPGNTYSGAATGPRFLCSNGGFVDAGGVGTTTYIPGSVSGTNVNGYIS